MVERARFGGGGGESSGELEESLKLRLAFTAADLTGREGIEDCEYRTRVRDWRSVWVQPRTRPQQLTMARL